MKLNKRFQLRLTTKINKLEANMKATIRCFVSVNAEKEIPFSTGCQIEPSNWSQDIQRINKNLNDENIAINEMLSIIDGDLRDLFNEMKAKREPFTTRMFVDAYIKKSDALPSFLEIWNQYLLQLAKNVDEIKEGTICEKTYNKYVYTLNKFERFLEEKKMTKSIMPYAITKELLSDFYEFLCKKTNFRKELIDPHGAYRDLKKVDKVLQFCIKKGYLSLNPFLSLDITIPTSRCKDIRYLSDLELQKIYNAKYLTDTERQIVDGFIFMSFSSLTYCDFEMFSKQANDFIKTDEDAYQYILKARYKNRKLRNQPDQHIPIIKILKEILTRYNFKIPVLANATYNSEIKRIAHRIGIENSQEITTYVGRKSAATFYANQDGVDIKTVAKILGHKHEITTRKFYAVTKDETVKRQVGKLNL